MRNLKSSSTVELVITSHLAFGHENQPRVRWALLYCCTHISDEMFFIPFNGAI